MWEQKLLKEITAPYVRYSLLPPLLPSSTCAYGYGPPLLVLPRVPWTHECRRQRRLDRSIAARSQGSLSGRRTHACHYAADGTAGRQPAAGLFRDVKEEMSLVSCLARPLYRSSSCFFLFHMDFLLLTYTTTTMPLSCSFIIYAY